MKKEFEAPQLQIIELEMDDIIATSGGYGAAPLADDNFNVFDPTNPLGDFIW